VFIDQVKVFAKAGDGGKGCRSFYRDKYTREGIPNGGDGGKGSDIIVRADRNLRTLMDLRYHREVRGKHGEHGSGKNMRGKDGEPVILRVPRGTLVKDAENDTLLRDLVEDGDEVIVAKGGRGGIGNRHRYDEATPGEPGEEKRLMFDLKLIADVGVVGFPNAGKSTLISVISNAHPDIAAYPFTTKSPVLGVVYHGDDSFVIADIPGLIEGSSHGRGLGDKFLRHVERTTILVHLIDMAAVDGRDPVYDYKAINKELKQYNKELARKPQIVVGNKLDLEGARENLARFTKATRKKVYPICAMNKEGIEELVAAIVKKLS
jgi:GTP-binding protein